MFLREMGLGILGLILQFSRQKMKRLCCCDETRAHSFLLIGGHLSENAEISEEQNNAETQRPIPLENPTMKDLRRITCSD